MAGDVKESEWLEVRHRVLAILDLRPTGRTLDAAAAHEVREELAILVNAAEAKQLRALLRRDKAALQKFFDLLVPGMLVGTPSVPPR